MAWKDVSAMSQRLEFEQIKGVRTEWHCRIPDNNLRHGVFFDDSQLAEAFARSSTHCDYRKSACFCR